MEKTLEYTVQFETVNQDKMSVAQTIEYVYNALIEKGYNPVNQIIGYILSGDSSYITTYKNARAAIKRFERDEILEELMRNYVETKLKKA